MRSKAIHTSMMEANQMTQLTNETRALIPVFNEYGEAETLVYQSDGVRRLKGSPLHLLESACLYYGSSIQGRIEAARDVLGPHRKTPVIMDWHADAVFFPTIAGESVEVPVSNHTVYKQKQRSIELSYSFQKRFH